jgi:hypothetical protein
MAKDGKLYTGVVFPEGSELVQNGPVGQNNLETKNVAV